MLFHLLSILKAFFFTTILASYSAEGEWCIDDFNHPPCNGAPGACTLNSDGSLGGFVANTATVQKTIISLLQKNRPFISQFAQICDQAEISGLSKILGTAKVTGNAKVYGHTQIADSAEISGQAKVYGRARIWENAKIFGDAQVYGNASVYGHAKIYERAQVFGYSMIRKNAQVAGSAQVYQQAQVYEDASVFEKATLFGESHVYGKSRVFGNAMIYERARVYDESFIYQNAKIYGQAHIHGQAHVFGNLHILGQTHLSLNTPLHDEQADLGLTPLWISHAFNEEINGLPLLFQGVTETIVHNGNQIIIKTQNRLSERNAATIDALVEKIDEIQQNEQEAEQDICPICHTGLTNVLSDSHKLVFTRCHHIFCKNCIERLRKCPVCRGDISDENLEIEVQKES